MPICANFSRYIFRYIEFYSSDHRYCMYMLCAQTLLAVPIICYCQSFGTLMYSSKAKTKLMPAFPKILVSTGTHHIFWTDYLCFLFCISFSQSSQPPSKDHGSSTGDGFKIGESVQRHLFISLFVPGVLGNLLKAMDTTQNSY